MKAFLVPTRHVIAPTTNPPGAAQVRVAAGLDAPGIARQGGVHCHRPTKPSS